MQTPTTPDSPQIQSLRDAYAALNRNDIPAFMSIFDPQIQRDEFLDSPHGSTHRGIPAVTEHVIKGRGSWAQGTCDPQQFILAGDHIIVLVHVHVRLKHETDWREGDVADLFTFRQGKATLFRSFTSKQQALDWAGINAP
jgi:uncharacterized protein